MPLQLDPRLQAVAALVTPGSRVADVGCDHGRLSVYLAQSGRASRVIASDLRSKPLAKARALVEKTGCGPLVECRLADGLLGVQPGEVDAVVLAGISGITICDILQAAPWVRSSAVQLVMVPANKPEILRRWLAENGFAIEAEQAAIAAGRPYAVLSARWQGTPFAPTELWCSLGLLADAPGEAALAWRRKELHRLERRLNGLQTGGGDCPQHRQALEQLIAEVRERCREQ